jgi:lycopene cyclase domain-containing protein
MMAWIVSAAASARGFAHQLQKLDRIMPRHYVYVIWLILFLGLPTVALAVWAWRELRAQARAILLTLAIALAGGWAWDKLAVNLGAWQFDPNSILGRWIGGLPVEEWCWITGTTVLFSGITVLLANRFEQRQAQDRAVEPAGSQAPHTAASEVG